MNKTTAKFFISVLVSVVFLVGCNNLMENTSNPVLLKEQKTETQMTNVIQSKREMLDDIKVSFSLINSQTVFHEPVLLNFAVQNNSAKTIKLDLGQDFKEGFLFTIIFPNGRRVQLPQLVREGMSLKGDVLIKPQQTYNQKILLNQWVDFNSMGKFKIEGRLANPIKTENGEITVVDSNFEDILAIQPRDTERLKEISASLLELIKQSNNYSENAEHILALSYINDPIAVPYLQKALTLNKMIEPIIIEGLERIGDKDSVQALITIINEKPNSEIASLAKFSLRMIENKKSSDSKLKKVINQFLLSNP